MKVRATRNALIAFSFLLALSVVTWEILPESKYLVSRTRVEQEPIPHKTVGYLPDLYAAYVAPDGRLFGIEDHFIFVSDDEGRTFRRLGALPKVNPTWRDRISDRVARSKLARRLRRNPGPTNLVVLASGTILVFFDYIYRSTDDGQTFTPVFGLHDEQLNGGFQYSEGIAVGPDDLIYFGEYTTSERPHAIRIVEGRADGTEWRVVHVFPPGDIFHVHGIQYDPFRGGYWVTTGDLDHEAKVLFTGDNFQSMQVLGQGSQDWRVVSMMIAEDRLVWGSDNDRMPAAIFQWDFATATLQKLREIGKPSYFSTVLEDGTMVLSTTYEPESSYTRAFHPEPTTDLWVSRADHGWTKLMSLPYQPQQHTWGPARASIAFPGGKPTQTLFFTPLSTVTDHFTTQLILLAP